MIAPSPGTTNSAHVVGRGTEIDRLVMGLIENAFDKDQSCRHAFEKALTNVGQHESMLVLSSCYSFMMTQTKKTSTGHRILIMNVMERVIRDQNKECETSFIKDVVKMTVNEMTTAKEVIPDWQTAASDLLVTLGDHHCQDVMEEIMLKFEPGVMPHFFVIQTVANMASRNAFGMLPFLHVVLGHLTTLMMSVKGDNMRWVFAHCVAKFCEAIIEYVANIERAPDRSVQKEAFSDQITAIFDVIFSVWLQSKEPKLRAACIDAIGQCSTIMSTDRLNSLISKIFTGLTALYKRHNEPYHVSRALATVLGVAKDDPEAFSMDSEVLFNVLFLQICVPIDYASGMSIRNRNELLRCFSLLCQAFPDRVVLNILGKLETNEKSKVAALAVVRYLVDSCDAALTERKSSLLSGLRTLVNDASNRVKKELAQVIISMGSHDYLGLEGGESMIEFLVRLCAIKKENVPTRKSTDVNAVSADELRNMGAMVLRMGSGSVAGMRPVMWPYMLELVLPEPYTDAVGNICLSMANILKGDMDGLVTDLNYDEMVNLPKPTDLFARLLVLAGRPCGKDLSRCVNILEALLLLCPNIHENLEPLCKPVIPKLIQFLNISIEGAVRKGQAKNEEAEMFDREFDIERWDELMLKMLSKCLEQIEDEDWTVLFGESLASQIGLYDRLPGERAFLYKCMGVVLKHSTKKDFVSKNIDVVFNSVRHSNQLEREGSAVCFGLCASAAMHLDVTLAKLKLLLNPESKRSGLLSFIKDKGPGPSGDEKDSVKSTIVLALGYVMFYAPKNLLVSRLETEVLKLLLPVFKNAKDLTFKLNLIRCVELIGRALDPDVFKEAFNFEKRNEIISYLLGFIRAESVIEMRTEIRLQSMKALNYLVRLSPLLTDHEQRDIVSACMEVIYPLPLDGLPAKKARDLNLAEMEKQEALMNNTLTALNQLMCRLLNSYFNDETLAELLRAIVPWVISVQETERQRSLQSIFELINHFLTNISKIESLFTTWDRVAPPTLSIIGVVLAKLVPRATDPVVEIRALSMDCIHMILKIQSHFEASHAAVRGLYLRATNDQEGNRMIEAVPTLKERLRKSDSNIMLTAVSDLSKILVRRMPTGHLLAFLDTLYAGLLDTQSHGSAAACVTLNTLFKVRSQELLHEVGEILHRLYYLIPQITFDQTKSAVLRAVRTLAQSHLAPVLATITEQPMLWNSTWIDMLRAVSVDFSLFKRIVAWQMEAYGSVLPYDERPDPRGKEPFIRVATHHHMSMLALLTEITEPEGIQNSESVRSFLMENYCRLLLMILASIASLANCLTPSGKSYEREAPTDAKLEANFAPVRLPLRLLKNFFALTESHDMMEEFAVQDFEALCADGEWQLVTPIVVNSWGLEGHVMRVLCESSPQLVPSAVDCVVVFVTSPYEPQRVMACSFFAALVEHQCAGHESLVQVVISGLLGRLTDESRTVRRLGLVGMANLAECTIPGVLVGFATTLLSTMMTGMDDRDDPDDEITIAAMDGLSRILSKIDEENVRPVLVNICLKIKPCFEKERENVRAAAFRLFGTLARFGQGPSQSAYRDQIEQNFVPLIVHINDPEQAVVTACKTTLKLVCPLLPDSTELNKLVAESVQEETNLHFGEFGNELMKRLIVEHADKMNSYVMSLISYFRSSWPEIRGAAAMLLGFALGNFTEPLRKQVRKEHVTAAMLNLLKDCDPLVRAKAAEAISLLHQY